MPPRSQNFVPRPIRDRWEAKIDRTAGCWNWTGAIDNNGYGKIQKGAGFRVVLYAHRLAYEFYRGPIPAGLTIDHLCRNRRCVNPEHLEVVTQWENVRRSESWTAQRARATHCIHGHEFTPENTQRRGGWRACRACMVVRAAAKFPRGHDGMGALNRAKTQCPNGHPYDDANTYRWNGGRYCRTCKAKQTAAGYQRRKALAALNG